MKLQFEIDSNMNFRKLVYVNVFPGMKSIKYELTSIKINGLPDIETYQHDSYFGKDLMSYDQFISKMNNFYPEGFMDYKELCEFVNEKVRQYAKWKVN